MYIVLGVVVNPTSISHCNYICSDHEMFNTFARDLIMQLPFAIPLPEEGSVFDYYLDLRRYQFVPWAERAGASSASASSSGYVALPELERIAYIADLYLSYGHNVLIVGHRGMGKTAFVEVYILLCNILALTYHVAAHFWLSNNLCIHA